MVHSTSAREHRRLIPRSIGRTPAGLRTSLTLREVDQNARTNRRLLVRSSSVSAHRRTCNLPTMLVPRLSAHRGKRHSQCNLPNSEHRDLRNGRRVQQPGRQRQHSTAPLLSELRMPPLCGLDRTSGPYRCARRHVGRTVIDQASGKHLECQRPEMGMPGPNPRSN